MLLFMVLGDSGIPVFVSPEFVFPEVCTPEETLGLPDKKEPVFGRGGDVGEPMCVDSCKLLRPNCGSCSDARLYTAGDGDEGDAACVCVWGAMEDRCMLLCATRGDASSPLRLVDGVDG